MTLELLQHVKVMLVAAKSAGLTAEHWYRLQQLADEADKAALVPPAPPPEPEPAVHAHKPAPHAPVHAPAHAAPTPKHR